MKQFEDSWKLLCANGCFLNMRIFHNLHILMIVWAWAFITPLFLGSLFSLMFYNWDGVFHVLV